MIEGIDIKYYQSHLDTSIDFHPDTTAITGLSMDGKTAILRAFDDLRTNRPLGIRRIYRYDQEPMEIVLRVDGHKVGKKKGEKPIDNEGNKNMYWIEYPDGSKREFKTIGVGAPPQEVIDLINVSDISIQKQLDAYLLVTSTAGEIAKTINRITGLDEGEAWVKQLNKGINDLAKEEKILMGQLNANKEELAKYDGVDDLRRDILQVKTQQREYDAGIQKISEIMDSINIIEGAAAELAGTERKREALVLLMGDWSQIQERMEYLKEGLDEITSAWMANKQLRESEGVVQELLPLLRSWEKLENDAIELSAVLSLCDTIRERDMLIGIAQEEVLFNKDKYAGAVAKLGKCFICGNEVNDPEKIRENI